LELLKERLRVELPFGQARVALGLICLPDDPASYRDVAQVFEVHLGTVHTHMRRIRARHPNLYDAVMAERRRQLDERHAAVVEERRERSLRWGRRRYAARFRQTHGRWPWEVMRDG
jgi:transposase